MTEVANRPASQRLTFYLPGLFSLQENGAASGPYRALETMLSRAQRLGRRRPRGYEEDLFALFDLTGQENADLPVAAVTRMSDMGVIDNCWWLRADPVHLGIDRDRLILSDARRLQIAPREANRLVTEIMEVFAADGWLLKAPHPERWYLKPLRAPNLITSPLTRVVGQDVRGFLPRGPDEKAWHTILNEIQILLHTSTVNVEREKEGRLPINSLWFWGGGRLPRIAPVTWARVWSNEPVTLSLAKLSGTPAAEMPSDYAGWCQQAGEGGEHLLVLSEAHDAAWCHDAERWREILGKLETDWMEPLLRELKAGAMERLTLITDTGGDFTLTPRRARRWWRRRRALAAHGGDSD